MIHRIEIGGKERPLSFSLNCLAAFQKDTGISFKDMGVEIPIYAMLNLIYNGFKDGARQEKQEFKHTEVEVGDWLGHDIELLNEIMDIFWQDWYPSEKNSNSPSTKE